MCRLMLCPNCARYRSYGCNDDEHRELVMANIDEAKRCKCREQQMAEIRARDEQKTKAR